MNVGVLVTKDLRRQWRDRKSIVIQLVVPVLLTVVMGLSFGGGIFGDQGISAVPMALVGTDVPQGVRDRLTTALEQTKFFKVTWTDSAQAAQKVANGELQAALVLPDSLLHRFLAGRDLELKLWKDPNSEIKAGIVETILTEGLRSLQSGEAAYFALWPETATREPNLDTTPLGRFLDGDPAPLWRELRARDTEEHEELLTSFDRAFAFAGAMREPRIHLDVFNRSDWRTASREAASRNMFDYFLPSIAVFFMMWGVAAIARDYQRERDARTLARVLLGPVTSAEVLLGKWATAVIGGAVQLSLLFALGAALFGMRLGPDPFVLLIAIVFSCAATASVYMVLALLARTEKALDALTTIFTLVSGMLGGNFFPTDFMPPALHVVGKITFNYWANSAFSEIIVHDRGLAAVAVELGVLLAITAVGLLVSLTLLTAARRRGVAA